MARLLLAGAIDHVQTSWVKLGVDGTRTMLAGGADDLGGTLMEETISRMAGSEHGSLKSVAELEAAIRRYIQEHNRCSKPFVWTKPADTILAKLKRLPASSE